MSSTKYRFGWLMVLTLLLLGVLAACGDSSTATPAPKTTPATTAPATTIVEATSTPVALANLPTSTPAPTATAPITTGTLTTTPATTIAATLVPRPVPAGLPGKLSLIGNDGQLYLYKFDGKKPQLILGKAGDDPYKTGDGQIFTFPTWSKDGSKLAVLSSTFKTGTTVSSDIYVVSADGSNPYKVRDGAAAGGVYLNFSPDGSALTMLVGGGDALELQLADTSPTASAKPPQTRTLSQGRPLYTSWSPDNDNLIIHTTNTGTETLSVLSTKNPNAKAVDLPGKPGSFRAPAWSGDGQRLAYSVVAAKKGDPETLIIAGKDGKEQARLDITELGSPSFNWSPDGKILVYATQSAPQSYYRSLYLTDGSGGSKATSTRVLNGTVFGFFWSPDGKKIAYASINSNGNFFTWNIYDIAANKSTLLVEWIPTEATQQILGYFDQYAQSDSFWSPDSKYLVFCGWDKAAIDQSASQDTPFVYILPTEGPTIGQAYIADYGELAFWSK